MDSKPCFFCGQPMFYGIEHVCPMQTLPPEGWGYCPDCARSTGGSCPRHLVRTIILPTIIIPTTSRPHSSNTVTP